MFARRPNLGGVVLGALSALGFAPFGLWPALIPAMVWLIWQLDKLPGRRAAFWHGWWLGLGQFIVGIYWIMVAWRFQSEMPVLVAVPIVLGLCAYLAIYTGLTALAARLFWHQGASRLLILAGCWVLGEALRGVALTGFPWNELGSMLVDHTLPLAQGAALVGQLGLSALVVMLCGAPSLWPKHRQAALAVVTFGLAAYAAGAAWMSVRPTRVTHESVRLHVVQANIDQNRKWSLDTPAELLATYMDMSGSAVRNIGSVSHGRSSFIEFA